MVIKDFLATLEGYPIQVGTSLNAAGINYQTLRAAEALKQIEEIQGMVRPNN